MKSFQPLFTLSLLTVLTLMIFFSGFGRSFEPTSKHPETMVFESYLAALGLEIPDRSKDHRFLIISARSCPGCNLAEDYCQFDYSAEDLTTILVFEEYSEKIPERFQSILQCNPNVTLDRTRELLRYPLQINTDGLILYKAQTRTLQQVRYSPVKESHNWFYSMLGASM